MTADADPYTNVIPGFIPTAQLTREWAQQALADRLTEFVRQLAEEVAPVAPSEGQVAA